MASKRYKDVYAVVLVGGKGKRLRPLSTNLRPKAFLSVTNDRETMFRNTIDRLLKLVESDHIVIVANKKHHTLVKRDLPKDSWNNILLEPVSRNTAPAIALAARYIMSMDRDAVMLVMPADHYIPDRGKEREALILGINFAKRHADAIITVGIDPKRPSTEYGYIKVSKSSTIAKVECFTEKPDIDTAERYIASGKYLWNAGIFIFRLGALSASLRKYAPKIFHMIQCRDPYRAYDDMPEISIDYAIMEKAGNIYCVKGRYEWNDVGSFDTLEKVLKIESRRFVKKSGKIIKII